MNDNRHRGSMHRVTLETAQSVLMWLQAQPKGATGYDVAAANLIRGRVKIRPIAVRLRTLRDGGLVQFIGCGRLGFWCTPDHIAATEKRLRAAKAASREASYQAKLERQRKAARVAWTKEVAHRAAEIEVESEKPFVHRIVCAHQAPPLRPRGPVSVWGLA